MAPNPVIVPRHALPEALKQEKTDPFWRLCRIPTPIVFIAYTVFSASRYAWPMRWILSGAPALTTIILFGASYGYRVLPFIHLWTLLATLHLTYAIAATSWLFYGIFAAFCWPCFALTCLCQFQAVANMTRGRLRSLLSQLQFVNDTIAFFGIPALELDIDVSGLFVIRGATLSLSSLTLDVHGIELGIKLTDDMELAIQVELVRVLLFRRVEISDVFMNLKGGLYEMTFGKLEKSSEDDQGNALMSSNTPLLRAASLKADGSMPDSDKVKMTDHMTGGKVMEDSSPREGLDEVKPLYLTDEAAERKFKQTMEWIQNSNAISRMRNHVNELADGDSSYTKTDKSIKAAICSHLHDTPSVPHPPPRSVKVSTLKASGSPAFKRFQHRFPLLLRLLLNPLSYFHPIRFSAITCTASGQWVQSMLKRHIFKDYTARNMELRNIEKRMSAWTSDANFVVELHDATGLAQVPVLTEYDIITYLSMKDILVYRAMPRSVSLQEVIRLGGADATFSIPSFLLPHHEHILPPKPTPADRKQKKQEIAHTDGKPQRILAESELEQVEKDETNVQMSVHARLPACLDQTLLDFVAALIKATKLVEIDKEPDKTSPEASDSDGEWIAACRPASSPEAKSPTSPRTFRDLGNSFKQINNATRDQFKKAMVGGMINDRWIAKLVGKLTKMLENAQGDIGYSGAIPVPLHEYRLRGVGEASKILP